MERFLCIAWAGTFGKGDAATEGGTQSRPVLSGSLTPMGMCEREVAEQCSFFGGTRNLLSDHGKRRATRKAALTDPSGDFRASQLKQIMIPKRAWF